MSNSVYVAFVGQKREFALAMRSHELFLSELSKTVDEIHVAYIVWDTSFSTLLEVKCFVEDSIDASMFPAMMPGVKSVIVKVINDDPDRYSKIKLYEDFWPVTYIHEQALDVMFDLEKTNNIQFSSVVLTRPDIYLTMPELLRYDSATIIPTMVYQSPGPLPLPTDRFFDYRSEVEIELHRDVFNICGRAAFIAIGLTYRYILAGENDEHVNKLGRPSMHRWMPFYLRRFGISAGFLSYVSNIKFDILRPALRPETNVEVITPAIFAERENDWENHSIWSIDTLHPHAEDNLQNKIKSRLDSLGIKYKL